MSAKPGDNSINAEQLTGFVERIEKLEEEKNAITEDIKKLYGEVKDSALDVATVRKIIRLRKLEAETRRMEAEMLESYLEALGMH